MFADKPIFEISLGWINRAILGGVILLPMLVFGFAFPLRFALPIAVALLGLAYWRAPQRPTWTLCFWAGVITMFPFAIEQAELIVHPSNTYFDDNQKIVIRLGLHLLSPLLILTCGLVFWGYESRQLAKVSENLRFQSVLLSLSFAALAIFLIGVWLGTLYPYVVDENLYLYQSTYVLNEIRGIAIDPWLEPFFKIRQSFYREGFLSSQYTPGWPVLLALFRKINLAEWAGACLYVVTLIVVAVWTRMLKAKWETVTLAVILTAVPFSHFYWTHSYLSGTSATLAGLLIAPAALSASRRKGWTSFCLWIAAGMSASALATIRPLTGTVGAILLGLWILYAGHFRLRSCLGSAIGLCVFGVPLLIYNFISTGHPLQFGYQLAQYGLQQPGFGWRGSAVLDPAGSVAFVAWEFTPLDALLNFAKTLGGVTQDFWPSGIIFFLFITTLGRTKVPWKTALPWIVAFLALPTVYSFYVFGDSMRVLEALPYATVGTALWLARALQENHRITRILIWTTILLGLSTDLSRLKALQGQHQVRATTFETVQSMRAEHGPLLIFVEDVKPEGWRFTKERVFESLWWFNTAPQKNVVVGRNLEDLRPRILADYPNHTPLLIRAAPAGTDELAEAPQIEFIDRSPDPD